MGESQNNPSATFAPNGVSLLVVIDRLARIDRAEIGGTTPERIVPHDADGAGRHLHYVQDDSNGQRRPEQRSYYDAIAKSLHGAEQILVFGGGTGASSAIEELLSQLLLHHKDNATHVVGSVAVEGHHLTEDQLLAKARSAYADLATWRSAVA